MPQPPHDRTCLTSGGNSRCTNECVHVVCGVCSCLCLGTIMTTGVRCGLAASGCGDMQALAEACDMFTGAELAGLCREAAITALREDLQVRYHP